MDISQKIKKFRKMRGISQGKLAEELGIAVQGVASYESGKRVPKTEVRVQMAHIMDVDPIELCDIDLTPNDELRILMKLLAKYADSIDTDKNRVQVSLPASLIPFAKKYDQYREITDSIEYHACSLGIDIDKLDLNDEDKKDIIDARDELMYWIDTWPQFDYLVSEIPDSKQHGKEEILESQFLAKYLDFKAQMG